MRTSTTLKPGDNLPGRGRSFKNLLLETIREKSHLDMHPGSTREEAEKAFIDHAAQRAFNDKDQSSATILNEFMKRSFPPLKPINETMVFSFPEDGTATQKAFAVVAAISRGDLPADIGQTVISIIKDSVIIEESTDLKERISKLEALIDG